MPDAIFSTLADVLRSLFPLAVTVTGPALWVYEPFHRARVEERVKARRITATEARRHLAFLRFFAPALTLLGTALLLLEFGELWFGPT